MRHVLHSATGQVKEKEEGDVILEEKETEFRAGKLGWRHGSSSESEEGRQALEEAHEQGVIHRDLKPSNIKRTPEGKIKVLDLGLAKALTTEIATAPASVSLSPTMTSANTVAGTLLGTAAYMSPEQVKGKEADRRADIWAFGCVLNEMLTGRRTFGGETISETLASVLRDEAEEDSLPADTPVGVRRLLRRCLDRNRQTRLRDIGEARIALSPGRTRRHRATRAGGQSFGRTGATRREPAHRLDSGRTRPGGARGGELDRRDWRSHRRQA